jgi:FKBP-type peptidyl-prolyl cis-trans isomerase FkpA
VRYRDVRCGRGAPAQGGDVVVVRYTARTGDGTLIDSSHRHGGPFRFVLGAGQVVAGWDEGIPGMREGGRRRLEVPPPLGFGGDGLGDLVPPGETLIFEVELVRASTT